MNNVRESSAVTSVPRRRLGRTGLQVSVVAFGAGPVSGLMTGEDHALQQAVVQRALAMGINWFDTAAGYGQGASESNLGRCLSSLPEGDSIHVATKVRISFTDSRSVHQQIVEGVKQSLERLKRNSVTLLQLHNGITRLRNDEPFSVSVDDILGTSGITDAMLELKARGLVQYLGLTGTGCSDSLRSVIREGVFDTIQIPYNLLNPSAGLEMAEDFDDRNYGNVLADSQALDMGGFAIRVFAGGALLGRAASAHTLKTPFFPLEQYRHDVAKSDSLRQAYGVSELAQLAIHFALHHPAIHSAIVGFGTAREIDVAVSHLGDP